MDTKKQTVGKLIDSAKDQFKIPYFQRSYVWEKLNWSSWIESLDDLMNSKLKDPSHANTFIGSIIIKIAEKARQGRANKFLVIDGQQRLTTTLVFLKACVDICPSLENEFIDYSRCNDDGTKNAFKLESSHFDKDFFISIINARSPLCIQDDLDEIMPYVLGDQKTRKRFETPHKLVQAYWYFWSKIKSGKLTEDSEEQNPEELAKALFYYTTDNLELITLELDENEDEQKIFDTINSLGVHLTTAEICKNEIFSKINESDTNKEHLYNATWKKIFEEDTVSFWNQQITIGRLSRSHLDSFLYAFLLIENPPENNYIKQDDLLNEYKKFLRTKNSDEIKELLHRISQFAESYYLLFNTKESLRYDDHVTRLMILIDKLDVKTLYPLTLLIANNMQINSDDPNPDLFNMFKYIECFIVRRFLTQEDEKSYSRLFTAWIKVLNMKPLNEWTQELKRLITDEQYQDSSSRKYPDNQSIKGITDKVYKSKHKSLASILFVIEAYQRKSDKQYLQEIPYLSKMTLEHIIPQTWDPNWTDVVTIDSADIIYTLGNFSLVTQSLNSSMRNYDWYDQDKKIGKYNKLKEFAHDFKINNDVLIEKKPVIDTIKARTDRLIGNILEIWSFE